MTGPANIRILRSLIRIQHYRSAQLVEKLRTVHDAFIFSEGIQKGRCKYGVLTTTKYKTPSFLMKTGFQYLMHVALPAL